MGRRRLSGAAAAVLVISAGVLVAVGWFGHESWAADFKVLQLPDGRSLVVLRRVEQAYPVYASTVKAELDLALDQKKKFIDASANGRYESDVKQLYQSLDSVNADIRTEVVAAYTGLIIGLSASGNASSVAEALKNWNEVLQLIVKEAARVRSINVQLALAATATSSGEWEELGRLGREAKEGADQLKTFVNSVTGNQVK